MEGCPGSSAGKESTCNAGDIMRREFNPWVGMIPWRRAWQPTPVFLPGESPWTEEPGGLQSTGSQRVRRDSDEARTYAHAHTYTHTHTRSLEN